MVNAYYYHRLQCLLSALTLFNTIHYTASFSIQHLTTSSTATTINTIAIARSSSSASSALGATWSNGQAIREYQDFLASGKQEIFKERDGPSVIVRSSNPASTAKPLVDALYSLGGGTDIVLEPNSPMPPIVGNRESFPIYIAVPPQELDSFLQNLPEEWKPRREDFVFLSGGPICGVIEPILKKYGLARDTMTQVMVAGFTTPGPIGRPQDLSINIGQDSYGENKSAGECASCGKWAGAIQERLEENGIVCKTGFYREWRRIMWERASFDAVFNIIGAVRDQPTTIKDVAKYYENEASDMLWQVTGALRGMLAVTLLYGFEERLFEFAERKYGEKQCSISDEMYPYMFCPPFDQAKLIAEYLNYGKDEKGLIPNTIVPRCSTLPSNMRQGNLRADGAV